MKTLRILLLLILTTGCADLIDALNSSTQGVSVVTRTPNLDDAQGLNDPTLAAALPLDDLQANATAVVVGIGKRDEPLSLEQPDPVTGATVSVEWDSNTVALCAGDQAGSYLATSIAGVDCADTSLAYVPGSTYETSMVIDSETFLARVVAPPAIVAANVEFTPAFGASSTEFGTLIQSHPANTELNVDWSADPDASARPAFITVFRVRFTGSGAADALVASNWVADPQPQYDSLPREAEELIKIVLLSDPPTDDDIPATVFDTAGLYITVLTPTEVSLDTDGLAVGSGALAGVGTAFLFWVE